MGLFFDILSAINHPNQQGSVEQLKVIVSNARQLGSRHGFDDSMLQTLLSVVGEFLRPVLRQSAVIGSVASEALIRQAVDTASNYGAASLPAFLTSERQQQLLQALAQRTGLSNMTLQAVLPGLLTVALGFLNLGTGTSRTSGANPVLKSFLTTDRQENADLGEVFKFANRFLHP
jgi:hypothetical protein